MKEGFVSNKGREIDTLLWQIRFPFSIWVVWVVMKEVSSENSAKTKRPHCLQSRKYFIGERQKKIVWTLLSSFCGQEHWAFGHVYVTGVCVSVDVVRNQN